MTLRLLTPDDASALRLLWAEGLRLRPEAFLLTEAELEATAEESLAAGIASALHYGAFQDDILVGFVIARRGGAERLRHTADIGPLYVTQGAGGQGHGHALMTAVLNQLKLDGLLQVELSVDAANAAAIALYEKLGFIPFGRRPRSVFVNGKPRTDFLMIRSLDGTDLSTFA